MAEKEVCDVLTIDKKEKKEAKREMNMIKYVIFVICYLGESFLG